MSEMVKIIDQPIRVWAPMDDDADYIAIIKGFPATVFYGASPLLAKTRAEAWRKTCWNDICKPAERVELTAFEQKHAPKPKEPKKPRAKAAA